MFAKKKVAPLPAGGLPYLRSPLTTLIDFSTHTLPNGLTLIHHPDTDTGLAVVNVLYRVGSRNESPDRTGFAHLFEHLMFGGSANIPEYDTPLQMAGGENNAFTSNDITNYYLTLPAANIETGFWLESDRMLQLDFSEKSLNVQRKVVCEEFKQRYLNQPYGDAWLKLRPLAYTTHPYRWATIGRELKHIEEASLTDVKDFFYRHYGPGNAVLVVSGNVSKGLAVSLAEKWFGSIAARNHPEDVLPAEPPQLQERRQTVKGPVPYPAIFRAYHMCSRNHPDYPAFDLLTDVLSGGKSSLLYQALVKENPLFSNLNAYVTGDADPGLLVMEGYVANGFTIEAAEAGLDTFLHGFLAGNLDETMLQKVKNRVESLHVFNNNGALNKAMNLAYAWFLGNTERVNTEIDLYRAVSAEQVMAVARKTLLLSNSSTLVYLPE